MTLKEAIELQGRKTKWVADQCGVSERSVMRWKSGKVKPIKGHQKLLARVLDVELEFD